MRKKVVAALAAVVVLAALVYVAVRDAGPSDDGRPGGGAPVEGDLLDEVYGRFDADAPGRGVTDYPGATVEDIPKSYAMIVLAELERGRHGIRPDLPDLSRTAGRWLLDNASTSADGTVGWGLPVAWDAGGDGSENPAGTVYSISTGIVVDALLTWMEADPAAPSEEILATVSEALDNFARAPATPDGLIPYSLESADRRYDVFNSAAYVAGQMQRFVKYASSPSLARRLTDSADATVDSLVRRHLTSPTRAWYWRYSLQEDNSNDMPHAGYIIDGLATYVREGGALAGKVDLPRVVAHLHDFFEKNGRPRAWPTFQTNLDRPPRLYDVGIALGLTCTEPAVASLTDDLLGVVDTYRAPDDAGFYKYPVGTPDQQELVVNEYEAYLWRGLVSCEVDEATRGAGAAARPRWSRAPGRVAPAPSRTVPFVRVGTGAEVSEVSFEDGRSTFDLPWAPGRRVSADGVVMQAVDDGAGGALLTRGYPDNYLSLVTLAPSGAPQDELRIQVSEGSAPMLRAATFHRGLLYVVHYDNPSLTNYLARFERRADGYVALGEPIALPSFEDPTGGTYEMIPAVFLLGAGDSLHVVAGTLQATVDQEGALSSTRVPNCLRAIEAVELAEGPVVLCHQKDEHGPGAPYELHGPDGVSLPDLGAGDGVPYRLRAEDGQATVSFAETPEALAEMLRLDLERTNAGWLEYGTDNVEGRVPWSQLYYLNGFLDLLLLADRDPEQWDDFSTVLTGVRSRLDQELTIADRHWREGRYETRAFTVDRSPTLFAVQTSRLLLAMQRYRSELRGPLSLPGLPGLRADVSDLSGHIDVVRREGQKPWWWPPGEPYLAFPKGSAGSFDGLNVPYNHQNEWAYAMTRAGAGQQPRADAEAIVVQYLRRIAPDGRFPLVGTWDYWWGQAYDGWTEADGVSTHTPDYDGDHIKAVKSFRSIDAMGVLAVAPSLDPVIRAHVVASISTLVARDQLYPFVGYELLRSGVEVELPQEVVRRYLRVSSPWELQSAAWAYSAELARLQPAG